MNVGPRFRNAFKCMRERLCFLKRLSSSGIAGEHFHELRLLGLRNSVELLQHGLTA